MTATSHPATPHSAPADAAGFCAKARLAMTRARSALVMDHPFFATLALRLQFKEDSSCRDLWTDGKTLGFNPVYAGSLPEAKLIGAQAHEVLHLAFGHHVRRKDRDKALWNRACDLAINQILLDAGFSLPQGFLCDPAYAGLSAEDIYEELFQMQERQTNKGAEKARHASPSGEDDAAEGASADGGRELAGQKRPKSGNRDEGGEERKEDITGLAPGAPVPESEKKGQPSPKEGRANFTGEVRDHPDIDGIRNDHARKAAEQEADIALTQAMQRARNMGGMPGGLSRLCKREWRPKLDWRELLRRFLESCADNDYSWTTPNRRYLHQDIYLPSRREARLPHIALAVDSSGSVDEQVLAAFCAELSSVLEAFDTTLTVLFHDSKVQSEHSLGRMDLPFSLTPLGGGGTDFRPVCDYMAERCLHPTCLIWFTDLECSRFPAEPDYPVLWVCSRSDPAPPPFGDLLTLPASVSSRRRN